MFKHAASTSLSLAMMTAALAVPSFAGSPTSTPGASSPSAVDPAKAQKRPAGGFVQRLEKDLSLTPEQTAKVREIFAKDASPAGARDKIAREREQSAKDGKQAGKDGKHAGKRRGFARGGAMPFGPGMGKDWAAQMRADNVDTAALAREWATRSAKHSEQHQARSQARFAKMRDRFVALHAVLTPEQRARLADRMEKREKRG